jgi:hypothetical protein
MGQPFLREDFSCSFLTARTRMAVFVNAILLLWLVLVPLAVLSRAPTHLVLGAALLLGLLFLPMVSEGFNPGEDGAFAPLAIPGMSFLSLTKYKVISLALLLAMLVKEGGRLQHARLSWVDVPMVVWCLCPLPSVLFAAPPPDGSSELTAGLGQCFSNCLLWGVPYYIGKVYFGSLPRLRDLAVLFVLGALLYVPLSLYEIRMSPQLHSRLYGFTQHDFRQTIRFDGFRPMVFLQHGLALGLFLTAATLVAGMLLFSGAMRPLRRLIPLNTPFLFGALLLLALTTVLTKSTGALLLGAGAVVVLTSACLLRTPWPLVCLVLVSPLYIAVRASGSWTAAELVPLITTTFGEDRAASFEFRQINEELLMKKALEGPPLGWAGWGRNYIQDRMGRNLTVPDGLWIITLGERGFLGLISLYLAMLLPVVHFIWSQPASTWRRPECAPATACAVVVALYMIDNLMNSMNNHAFILMAGALAALPRPPAPVPPRPLSVTDRRVFRWALFVTRLGRSRMGQPRRAGSER